MQTLKEIRDHINRVTNLTQQNTLVDECINLTLQEINDPAWAMKGYNHNWSFNRRKHSFATVASTEDYQLPRDLDKISLIRQTESPTKICYVPDEIFYRFIPNPETEGNPLYYRIWEEEGVSTRLAADDTIDIVSSSTSDTSACVLRQSFILAAMYITLAAKPFGSLPVRNNPFLEASESMLIAFF